LLPGNGLSGLVHWSPDGDRLAVSRLAESSKDLEGTLGIWHAGTGKVQFPLRGQRASYWGTWSPDGRLLTTEAGGTERKIKVWDTKTWKELHTLTESPIWNPDSRRLAFSKPGKLEVRDATTGKVLFSIRGPLWAGPWSPNGRLLASFNPLAGE